MWHNHLKYVWSVFRIASTAEDGMLTSMNRVGHERLDDEVGPEGVVVW